MKRKTIPLSVPNLKGNELKYVTEAIETEWVSTGGLHINKFEQYIAEYVKTPNAVSCQNGTTGLHLALLLAGVCAEDIVIAPTLTFIAAVNPIRYLGAEPVFLDCDDSLCLDANSLEHYCSTECKFINGKLIDKSTNKHVKAVMVVHIFGNMANLEQIIPIAEKYNLKVIEDATEALGTYNKNKQFAGTIGVMGVYSFNGNKIITTGGGGMLVSQDVKLLQRAKHLSTQAKSDEVNYIHDEIGYNYRMTNLQAAMGLAQMEQLETFINIKIKNYQYYREYIEEIPHLRLLPFRDDIRANHWFYSLYIDDCFPLSHDQMIKEFYKHNIQTRPIWGLIHEQIPYRKFRSFNINKAIDYHKRVVNIPCSTNLTNNNMDQVVDCIRNMVN
ncbi:MAG: LegC family aminotransferase [Peptostreptococcales bacterium]